MKMEPNITPEEKELMKKTRDRGFKKLKKFALIQIAASLAFFAVGVADAVYAVKNPQFPYIVLAPLWVSVLVIVAGICGFLAGSNGANEEEVSVKVRAYFITHYVLNVICIIFCGLTLVWGVWELIMCLSTSVKVKAKCLPEVTAMTAISGAIIGLGLVMLIMYILGTCFLCCYGRALGFKSKRERRLECRMAKMQRQLDAERAGNAVQYQGQGQSQGLIRPEGHLNQGYYQWNQQ